MGEAGSFKVLINDAEVRFASLEPLLTHMARAESYVLRYAPNFPDSAILHQLRTVDESIRARWAEHLRIKRTTLDAAILESEPVAAGLWIQAPTVTPAAMK
eukprot:4885517-Amphidinium_carterae.1